MGLVLSKYLIEGNITIFLPGSFLEDPITKAMCICPALGLLNRSRKSPRNPKVKEAEMGYA